MYAASAMTARMPIITAKNVIPHQCNMRVIFTKFEPNPLQLFMQGVVQKSCLLTSVITHLVYIFY